MIEAGSYTREHIEKLARGRRVDRQIVERSVFALGLLEALVRVGTPMRFKGGSSLMLLLEEPMRLSTDIDVVVPPGTDMGTYLEEAAQIFPFKHEEEQVRRGRNGIVNRHFKFFYDSPLADREFHILLDVLFEDDHYARIEARPIAGTLLLQDGTPPVEIEMPTADCILGDKLTAFAPHTTGIPLGVGKDLEVVKQMYDVATLVDASSDFRDAVGTFGATVSSELSYRGLNVGREDVLMDSIEAAACIASRGRHNKEEYPLYLAGIRSIVGHVFGERFSAERAVRSACKAMYAAASVLTDQGSLTLVDDPSPYLGENVSGSRYADLSRLRRLDPVAFAYLVKSVRLIDG